MSKYCFFTPESEDLARNSGIKERIEAYASARMRQTYVLHKPLSKEDSSYDYQDAVILLSAGCKPCVVDLGANSDGADDFVDDLIEDIAFLSQKYKYIEKIGRKKHWASLVDKQDKSNLDLGSLQPSTTADARTCDLLTSLMVGSINDIDRVDIEPEDVLQAVKSKIILFDTDQTSFVFRSNSASKRYAIQGLAGSGKTELLLHKIKEIYSKHSEDRIAFTCFNKILASSMRNRIPDFFDFMRVDRQIEWDKKLFCFHSWGSGREPLSGMYRYICHSYAIPFGTFQAGSFESLCRRAIDDIKSKSEPIKAIFDYVFVDESQDFGPEFLELCELVTEKKVYIAGDVFQNIFRPFDDAVNKADMVLKKCYRTDPTNLMFSHSLGMGLFEVPVMRWLKDDEWAACGYELRRLGEVAQLSRDPLRRFEDIPESFKSTHLHHAVTGINPLQMVVDAISSIKKRHPTAVEGDFAVIFLDKGNNVYEQVDILRTFVSENFKWNPNVSFETKQTDPNRFFISNVNNAKGLEFPFVICVANNLNRSTSFRNALYTMMARSFLESHLVVGPTTPADLVKSLNEGLGEIYSHNYMEVRIPPPEEIAHQQQYIVLEERSSLDDSVREFCNTRGASPRLTAKLISRIHDIIGDSDYDETYLKQILEAEYGRNKSI
ncbi:DEAD/DEAH box helicase [Stenotrophomonas sp. CC120223-11]|uniref:DEAD/DEAH box helicase n=1 Tax=unclassified Stenotrophomonas TaxID=196198 RepID=UPI000BDC558D|nr:ATP-binding domain-containing protein [Stenotrophomonas sp. CC120223-11]SNY65049.1 Superfamily I DNA and RNA helicases [Stenotrophomonas sp. CC120223-11]